MILLNNMRPSIQAGWLEWIFAVHKDRQLQDQGSGAHRNPVQTVNPLLIKKSG